MKKIVAVLISLVILLLIILACFICFSRNTPKITIDTEKDPYFQNLEQQADRSITVVKDEKTAVAISKAAIESVYNEKSSGYEFHVYFDSANNLYYVRAEQPLSGSVYIMIEKNNGGIKKIIKTKF